MTNDVDRKRRSREVQNIVLGLINNGHRAQAGAAAVEEVRRERGVSKADFAEIERLANSAEQGHVAAKEAVYDVYFEALQRRSKKDEAEQAAPPERMPVRR